MNDAESLLESKLEEHKETVDAKEQTREAILSTLRDLEGLPIQSTMIKARVRPSEKSVPLTIDTSSYRSDFKVAVARRDRMPIDVFKATVTDQNTVKIEAGSGFVADAHDDASMRLKTLRKHGFTKGPCAGPHGVPSSSWSEAEATLTPEKATDFFTDMLVVLAGEENVESFLSGSA